MTLPQVPPATPPTDPPSPVPASNEQFPTSWEEVFKHIRFKELNTRAQTAEQQLTTIKADEQKKNEEALKEQNKWKELYEGSEKNLNTEKSNYLRLKILTAKILPDESKELLTLIDRLRGDTAEDIEKDADSLLSLVKPAGKQQNSNSLRPIRQNNSTSVIDLNTETDPAKIRAAVRAGNT